MQSTEQLHAYDCHQNAAEPQATETTKKYTRVHRNINFESGLAVVYTHAAHRLIQHTLQVMEMAWTDDSTLAIFSYMRYW